MFLKRQKEGDDVALSQLEIVTILGGMSVSAAAGFMRGMSGFGSALLYMPVMSALYDPPTAAATLLLVDFISGARLVCDEARNCVWQEVWPISLVAVAAVPIGAYILSVSDSGAAAIGMRRLIAGVVVLSLLLSTMKVSYKGPKNPWLSIVVGGVAGFVGGLMQIEGPLLATFWLFRVGPKEEMRANLVVFIASVGFMSTVAYIIFGLVTVKVLVIFAIMYLPFYMGMRIGAASFMRLGDETYMNIVRVFIAAAAVLSFPMPKQ